MCQQKIIENEQPQDLAFEIWGLLVNVSRGGQFSQAMQNIQGVGGIIIA